jgi:hypothetical protein
MAKTLRKLLPKDITNKEVAQHWHQSAYPGEAYDSGNKEYFENMLSDHHDGKWQMVDLPIAQTSGHHSGHDMSEQYINEFQKLHSTGSEFPPIIARPHDDKPGYRTIDGQHRLEAARQLGHTHIKAYVPMRTLRDLKKMSQPRLQFPKLSGVDSRPDQDVRQIATQRQKDIYGKVVANAQHPDTTENYSESSYNPMTREFTHTPSEKRHVSRQTLRDKYASRIGRQFSSNTLGLSAAANKENGKTFNAALSGAQRTKFEPYVTATPDAGTADKQKAKHDVYQANLKAWIARADELKAAHTAATTPADKMKTRIEFNHHVRENRPRRPRKLPVKKKGTHELPPDQQILRGKNVDATIEHEGAHALFRQVEARNGKVFASKVKADLLASIPKELRDHLVQFVLKRGYKTRSPHFGEEVLTHARDILVSPTKRKLFETQLGPEKARDYMNQLKRSWKDIVNKAKKVDDQFLESAQPLAASEQLQYYIDPTPEAIAVHVYGESGYLDCVAFRRDNDGLTPMNLSKSEETDEIVRNLVQNTTGLKIND